VKDKDLPHRITIDSALSFLCGAPHKKLPVITIFLSMVTILLWAISCIESIKTGIFLFKRKVADEYFFDRLRKELFQGND
jgi:hypothetical protein